MFYTRARSVSRNLRVFQLRIHPGCVMSASQNRKNGLNYAEMMRKIDLSTALSGAITGAHGKRIDRNPER